MSKKDKKVVSGSRGFDPSETGYSGRAWSSTIVKVGLGNFSSIEFAAGASVETDNTIEAIAAAHAALDAQNAAMIERKLAEFKELEGEVGYGG